MEIPVFLAMTAGELAYTEALPPQIAWMGCHFSPYHTGLSNLPEELPPGSMLMLNDRTPPCGHDPRLVAELLKETAQQWGCSCILLDFQRPENKETASIVEAVLENAGCTVGVSSYYGRDLDCPVLLPPITPHTPPEEALVPWQGREIWLELSWEGTLIRVTEEGSQYIPLPHCLPGPHQEERLHCHYEISVTPQEITFQLGRTREDQAALLKDTAKLGVTKAVGLWQELKLSH